MPPSTEFIKVINDFISAIRTTFPEYSQVLDKWATNPERLYYFCMRKYPSRSGDIFSKNVSIFDEDSEVDTEFLPHIHFKNLWQYEDLSENSKETIWGYLQLLTLSLEIPAKASTVSPSEEDMNAIVQNALEHMTELWKNNEASTTSTPETNSETNEVREEDPNVPHIPQMNTDMFEGIFSGKMASIAKELVEETAGTLNFDENASIEEATKQLFTNPENLSNLMKSVSTKLTERMSNGELDQQELMNEAMAMMGKMGSVPGLGDVFGNMFNAMTNGGNPHNSKSKTKVTQNYKNMTNQEKIRARLRNKVNNTQQLQNKNMK